MGYFSGVDVKSFKNLWAWAQRIEQRPAVQAGTSVPKKGINTNTAYLEHIEQDKEAGAKHKDLHDLLTKAKEQYNVSISIRQTCTTSSQG